MIIVDTELRRREEAETPVRVGMVGAGSIARANAIQIVNSTPGMVLTAISNRSVDRAVGIWTDLGADTVAVATDLETLERHIGDGTAVVTADHTLLAQSGQIDVILELTGAVEFGTLAALAAIDGGKHFVTMNAEMDATVGPILRKKAEDAGVIYTVCEGDQPGVQMNLYRWVKTLGLTPLVCGNIKGMIDFYRTPETQKGLRQGMEPEPLHGHQFRRRHQGVLRTGDRGQCHRHVRGRTRHGGPRSSRAISTGCWISTTWTSSGRLAAWWITRSAPNPRRGSMSSGP
jgi:predicted homoserine dehydrogenase-like protein